MPRRSSASISKKALAKAEADFTTWLMMAKLGSFDDLPPTAQGWLMNYRGRLQRMKEAEATRETIREVHASYYTDMGGEGEAPHVQREPQAPAQVVDLKAARQARTRTPPASASSAADRPKSALQPLLIFAGIVAVLATIKFAFSW